MAFARLRGMGFIASWVALVALLQPIREPQLLSVSRLITEVGPWVERQYTVGDYRWWSPHQILAFYGDKDERLIDIERKTVIPFPCPAVRDHDRNLSPDRTMVIRQIPRERTVAWLVTDPAGRKVLGSWSIPSRAGLRIMSADYGYEAPKAVWSATGHSIYQVVFGPEGAGFVCKVAERPLPGLEAVRAFPPVTTLEWDTHLLVHHGKALLVSALWPDGRTFTLREWELAEPVKTARQWKVIAPNGQVMVDYKPSPDFRKALWLMGRPGAPVEDKLNPMPKRSISLWVSGLHGDHMTEIGAISFPNETVAERADKWQHFGALEWNPDCEHVSFIYFRKLYMVSTRLPVSKAP